MKSQIDEARNELMRRLREALFANGPDNVPSTGIVLPVLCRLAGAVAAVELNNEESAAIIEDELMSVLLDWKALERIQ
jgi:hypothetical protein